jgi:hypothetical protein
VYRLVVDPAVVEQTQALPDDALPAYAEVLPALEIAPWNGRPHHAGNPDGAVRAWLFGANGAGQVVYLILEEQQEVHLLHLDWIA